MACQVCNKVISILLFLLVAAASGCMSVGADELTPQGESLAAARAENMVDASKKIEVTGEAFSCLKKMHPVRGFFVNNLLGDLDATVAVAMEPAGKSYPPGSIVQLIPGEAMLKHHRGWSKKTNDWEFFELDVSEQGAKIKVRGTTQVVNKFGGNCFDCHSKAEQRWDFICEDGHGCDPLPIPDFLIRWTQSNDPRCTD